MKAIIITADLRPCSPGVSAVTPSCLMPLVDKPFLQHIVEYVIAKGVTSIDFILVDHPHKIETLFGDGSRWNCPFNYYLAKDPVRCYKTLKLMAAKLSGQVLVIDGNVLPSPVVGLTDADNPKPHLWMTSDRLDDDAWTGWTRVSAEILQGLPDGVMRSELFSILKKEQAELVAVSSVLETGTFEELQAAQSAVILRKIDGLTVSGAHHKGEIIVGRGARIDPTAQLQGPLYIGEYSHVAENAWVGPGTVIGRECIVDSGSTVAGSIVLPGTYIGRNLEIDGCLAVGSVLYNAGQKTESVLSDNYGIGSSAAFDRNLQVSRILSRLFAALVLLFTWPILLIMAFAHALLYGGRFFYVTRSVALPAQESSETWSYFDRVSFYDLDLPAGNKAAHFFLLDFPGLINVLRGDLYLVGAPARTAEQVASMPTGWRKLYLRSKAGLITEARAHNLPGGISVESHAAEVFYAVNASWKYDVKLIMRFLLNQITGKERSAGPATTELG